MTVPNDSAKVLTMVERVSRAKGWHSASNTWYVYEGPQIGLYVHWCPNNPIRGDVWLDPLTALLWTLLACLDDVEGEPARLLLDAHEDRNDARDRLTVLADRWAGGEVTTTVAVDVPEKWSEPFKVDVPEPTLVLDNGEAGSVRPVGFNAGPHGNSWLVAFGDMARLRVAATTRLETRNLAPMAAWIIAWLDGWRGETRALFEAEMMAAANEVWERLTVRCSNECSPSQIALNGETLREAKSGYVCVSCDGHGRVPKREQPEDPEWFGVIDDVEVTLTRRELMVLRVGDGIGDLARVDGIERYMGLAPVQLSDEAQDIEGTRRVTVTLRSLRTGNTSEIRAAWRV